MKYKEYNFFFEFIWPCFEPSWNILCQNHKRMGKDKVGKNITNAMCTRGPCLI
jgi:hypothetical protein